MPEETRDPFAVDERRLLLADVVHEGAGPFQLTLVDRGDGDRTTQLSRTGAFEGRIAAGVDPGTYAFEVVYSEGYELAPVAVSRADVAELPVEREGEDHGVVGPLRLAGEAAVEYEVAAGSRVVSRLLDPRGRVGGVLVNEPGPFRGARVVETRGVGFLTVEAEGPWALRVTETEAG